MAWMACYRTFFSAAHLVPGHPQGGRVHGHDFQLRVCVCRDRVSGEGFVVDYYVLRKHVESIVGLLDHRLVNDVIGSERATVEDMVSWIWGRLGEVLGDSLCLVEVCGPPDFCVSLSRGPLLAP